MATPMQHQDPKKRINNFEEVTLGYTEADARLEAKRCLQCKAPKCRAGCPVEIDIPAFILKIVTGEYDKSIGILKASNSLPAVCGRVCPQENQCEKACILNNKNDPISIGRLERFSADQEIKNGRSNKLKAKTDGLKVAVVGSGPAGLTCAGDLARMGYSVTMFESLHKTGGVLSYGIPEFRLPKSIVEFEVEGIRQLGVDVQVNTLIGRTLTIEDLKKEGFKAVFIGSGAGLPQFLKVPGENLGGVYSANEFLTRVNLMKAYLFPEYLTPVKIGKRVAVVGAGNVAMDAARCSLRLGAEEVTIVYRRSNAEMPARIEEIENAKEEGVQFRLLANPTGILGANGWVTGIECIKMELGEPDDSGRRRPVPLKGSEFVVDVDTVIVAIGNNPNPLLPKEIKGLSTEKWGGIIVDKKTGQTSIPYIFAGGDIVSGAATVIEAMGAGKRSARAIDKFIKASK
jgi:glutamate synthase (NADPH) small chain